MIRKLQHATTALTATAAVFGFLLLAGGPPQPAPRATDAVFASIDAAASPGESAGDAATEDRAPVNRRHQRRVRAALALPYFSFAQGLRRVTGS
jgi:hypothetical protein